MRCNVRWQMVSITCFKTILSTKHRYTLSFQTNYSNLMDEKDLYVPEGAGNAEQHPQSRPKDTDLDEFDPLASYPHHELSTVAEKEPIELEFEEGQVASKPKDGDGDKKNEEDLKPKEPETPVDKADEEVIERRHHIPLTTEDDPINVNEIHVEPQRDYNEIGEFKDETA